MLVGSSRLGALLAGLLATATFAGTARYGFVYDDRPVVEANPAAHDPTDWRAILLTPSWGGAAYRPLTVWTFAANHALHGPWPGGYHLTNVALHAGAAALVVVVAARLGAPLAAATIAGVLFAVHPVHTEAVASIVGRAEILCAIWVLLALLAHARGGRAGWRWRDVAAVAGCVLAGLLSKEYAVTLVVLLPLLDLLVIDGGSRARFAAGLGTRRLAVYAVVALVAGGWLVARHAIGRAAALWPQPWMNPIAHAPVPERLLTALDVQARAAALLAVPHPLRPDYSAETIPVIDDPASPRALVGIGVALGLVALGVALARRETRALFWLLFAAATWSVVSNLVVPSWVLFAERLVYLPSAGACVLAALAVGALASRARWWVAPLLTAVIVTAWMPLAWRAQRVWRDERTLAQAMVAASPQSAHAHHVLGRVYAKSGELDRALVELERAIALDPAGTDALYDAALVHRARGRYAEARRLLRRLVRQFPSYSPGAVALAATELDLGRPARALAVAEHAAWYATRSAELQVERALALDALGREDEARAAFERALRLAPGMAAARRGLARLAVRTPAG
ncbi:MAG TPA: tetratricopeptide repeat protein [Candidatus Limnocylindria bacterium]|nr:tetratricopeptide repeat protein [Candidatus Limnocylindria bacterium]